MKVYDLYFYGDSNEVIIGWHAFQAPDDETAINVALALAQPVRMELCRDSEIVKRWDAPK